MTSGDAQKQIRVEEGAQVDIHCQTDSAGSLTIWFRVLDKSAIEFIGSFSNGVKKETENKPSSVFSNEKIKKNIITLKGFSADQDSGLYSCATLIKGKELSFGPVTKLFGGELSVLSLLNMREASEPTRLFHVLRQGRTKTHSSSYDPEATASHVRASVPVRRQKNLRLVFQINLEKSDVLLWCWCRLTQLSFRESRPFAVLHAAHPGPAGWWMWPSSSAPHRHHLVLQQ